MALWIPTASTSGRCTLITFILLNLHVLFRSLGSCTDGHYDMRDISPFVIELYVDVSGTSHASLYPHTYATIPYPSPSAPLPQNPLHIRRCPIVIMDLFTRISLILRYSQTQNSPSDPHTPPASNTHNSPNSQTTPAPHKPTKPTRSVSSTRQRTTATHHHSI